MADVDTLEKRLNHLEYDEIKPLKEEVNEIKVKFAENVQIIKQAVVTNEKLSGTLDSVKTSLIQLTESMKNNNIVTNELVNSTKSLSQQFTQLDKKVEEKFDEVDIKVGLINDKSKIDILDFLKNNWLGIVMGVGAILYAMSQIEF